MAGRFNLGTLTVDMVAKTAGFAQGMTAAERASARWRKSVQKDINAVKSAALGMAAGVGAALGVAFTFKKFIDETVAAQHEQAQLAAVLKSTSEAAGYSQKQLNAMAEAMSAASTASSGEINNAQTTLLAYTNIVGEDFPRALQAAVDMSARLGTSLVSSAELVGKALDIPSQGMTALSRQGFKFSEDQKIVIKRLEETGRLAEAQSIIMEALEESYGGAAKAARDTLGGALTSLGNTINMMFASQQDMQGLTDSINDLSDTLSRPEFSQAISNLGAGIAWVASVAAQAVISVGTLGESVAAMVYGIAADDVVRLKAQAESLRKQIATNENLNFKWAQKKAEQQREELAIVEKRIKQAEELQRLQEKAQKPVAKKSVDEGFELKLAKQAEAAQKAAEEARKAAEARKKAIDDVIGSLKREYETFKLVGHEITVYDLKAKGATPTQIKQAQAIIDKIKVLQEEADAAAKVVKTYDQLKAQLDPVAAAQERYKATIKEIEESSATAAEKVQLTALAIKKLNEEISKGATVAAPTYRHDTNISGALGDMLNISQAGEELSSWYADQFVLQEENLARQLEAHKNNLDEQERARKEYSDNMVAIDAQLVERQEELQKASMVATSAFLQEQSQVALNQLAALGKESSAIYKTLFLANQAAAIANTIINTEEAAIAALKLGPVAGLIMSNVVRGLGYASVGIIAGTTLAGMAHSGIDEIPREGTWLLDKGERVVDTKTNMDLKSYLQEKKEHGSGVVVNVYEDRSKAGRVEESTNDQMQTVIDIFVSDIAADGRSAGAIQRKFGLAAQGY